MPFFSLIQILIQYFPLVIKNIPLFFKMLGIAKELIHFLNEKDPSEHKETIAQLQQGIVEARDNKDVSRIEKVFVHDRIVKGL